MQMGALSKYRLKPQRSLGQESLPPVCPEGKVPKHGVGPLLQNHGWDDIWCFPLSSTVIPVHCTDHKEALVSHSMGSEMA